MDAEGAGVAGTEAGGGEESGCCWVLGHGFWGTGFGVRVGRLSRSGIEEGEVGEGEKGEVEGMDESEESEEEKADEENKEKVGGEGSANDERKYSGDG